MRALELWRIRGSIARVTRALIIGSIGLCLAALDTATQSQAQTEVERADEQAIVDIGHLSALPPMGL